MPSIVKNHKKDENIQPFDFFAGFEIQPDDENDIGDNEEMSDEDLAEYTEDDEHGVSVDKEIIEQARQQAEKILEDARIQADFLREKGNREGVAQGRQEGIRQAYEEQRKLLDQQVESMQEDLEEVIRSVSVEKEAVLEQYIDDLKKISLAVAEKIIQTSLRSSGDIVKRMILSATEKMTKKRWAKIYVTKSNAGVSMEVDTEFLELLSHLSDNIKIITMDGEEDDGTCIIELPDEIIDASVSTQIENIKDILNNVRT